jgi:hypothetical protein
VIRFLAHFAISVGLQVRLLAYVHEPEIGQELHFRFLANTQ